MQGHLRGSHHDSELSMPRLPPWITFTGSTVDITYVEDNPIYPILLHAPPPFLIIN